MNIIRFFVIAAGATLFVGPVPGPAWPTPHKTPRFIPPGIVSASDIQYPVNSMAAGAVSLLLSLDSSAKIQNVQVLRAFPSLTSSVQDAVQNWKLTPATLNGHTIASEISVTVIFNIFNPGGGAAFQRLVLAPPQTIPPDASQFTPPQINMASFAKYPANSVSVGTVVLDVTVDKAGKPSNIRVIRGVPTLTEQAVLAVKNWGFNAATIQGQPTVAQMAIAFVFQRNIS
jgi:TonB family protein